MRRFLLNLTSRRAFDLFLAAFFVGALSIWYNFFVPWFPAAIVVVYGCVLFYSAKVLLVAHSEMTNNSPYFLGFLLFLVSLFVAFNSLSDPNKFQLTAVLGNLGTALLTTIVGLPFRQLLFAYSPGQADQDTFFRTLEEELRRSAAQFRKSQTELIELLQEFIATRQALFAEEERAAKRYVGSIEKAASIFDQAFDKYPAMISTALADCAKGVAKVRTNLDELVASSKGLNGPLFAETVQELERLGASTKDAATRIQGFNLSLNGLSEAANRIPGQMQNVLLSVANRSDEAGSELLKKLKMIQADVEAVDHILNDFIKLATERIERLK